MAKKKQGGKTAQHKPPKGKRLGVKVGNLQKVTAGSILVRQRGTKVTAGEGVKTGRDHSLYAIQDGVVTFGQGDNFRSVQYHFYVKKIRRNTIRFFVKGMEHSQQPI